MNIVTSQPATAAPATGGTPVEGFSPDMGGYSENLASQPNNDAELPSGEKALRFEREVVPLHEVLYQHALHMCHNHADAEDLVQDTMVTAYSSFHSFVPDTNLKAWLYRIQTNTYIDGYRRKLRQPIQCSTNWITEQELAAHARRTSTGPIRRVPASKRPAGPGDAQLPARRVPKWLGGPEISQPPQRRRGSGPAAASLPQRRGRFHAR